MKKLITSSTIAVSVGLVLVLVGGILRSITFDTAFNPATLANASFTIGYLIAVLSGVLLAGCSIVSVIQGGDAKKLMMTACIITVVGITMVLTGAVLGTITSWGSGVGQFNPTNTNAFNSVLNTIGYLATTLAGVVFVATAIATNVAREKK